MDRIEMLKVMYKNREKIKRLLDTLSRPNKTTVRRCILEERASEQRHNPTKAEIAFKNKLYTMGEKPIRTQFNIQYMIIDIVLPMRNLLIEVDGGYHGQSWKKNQDKKRDEYLLSLGFNTARITNEEVFNTQYIQDILDKYPTLPDNEPLFYFLVARAERRFKPEYMNERQKRYIDNVMKDFVKIYTKDKPFKPFDRRDITISLY